MRMIRITFCLGLAGLVALSQGCGRDRSSRTTQKQETIKVDPWEKVVLAFGKLNTLQIAEIRRSMEQLNSEIANVDDASLRPSGLTAEQEATYQKLFPGMTSADWPEITSSSFTKLDPTYLYECLFFREAVQSLELNGLPPAEQARLTFNWVCRLMYLNPVIADMQNQKMLMPPSPPGYALRRGWGSGLERAFVFLAACQQAGLEPCLIGPPGMSDKLWSNQAAGTTLTAGANGPFWGVGVRVGKDIHVFNPWKGEAAKGPKGTIATLAQLKANPDLVKSWYTGEAGSLTADVVKSSEPYLALPNSAMARRWDLFEKKLGTGLNLFVDPVALQASYGADVKFWCPSDPFDYIRSLSSFLPVEDGGRDQRVSAQRFLTIYRLSFFPRSLFQVPPELTNNEAVVRLVTQSSSIYATAFLEGITPRERIERGQFFEVTKDLVEKENRFAAAVQRSVTQQSNIDQVRRFSSLLNEAFEKFTNDAKKSQGNPVVIAQGQQAIEQLLKENTASYQMLLDSMVGRPSAAEAMYLLACCKQELAERFQARADRVIALAKAAESDPHSDPAKLEEARKNAEIVSQKARDAWAGTSEWWARYESVRELQGRSFPGRDIHAKMLAERAANPNGK
ncbi:MAG: hypothetical protein U0798_15770 [Gemmataceae bacterium]